MDLTLWRLMNTSTSNSQAESNLWFSSRIVVRTRHPSASENSTCEEGGGRREVWRIFAPLKYFTNFTITTFAAVFKVVTQRSSPVWLLRDDPKETTMSTVHAENKGLHAVKFYFV